MIFAYYKECIVLTTLIIFSYLFVLSFNRNQIFLRWTLLWIFTTAAAIFLNNFYFFTAAIFILCFFWGGNTVNQKLTTYFLLLPAVPLHVKYSLPGILPGIQTLIDLNYFRLLNLFLLIPCLIILLREEKDERKKLFNNSLDKYVLLFLIFVSVIAFRDVTITVGLRKVFYHLLDILIPYYVISRSVRTLENFKEIFSAILYSAIILSVIGIFEEAKGWLLYQQMFTGGIPIHREGFLRVQTVFGSPIAFGFFITLALGVLLFLKDCYKNQKIFYYAVFCLLAGCLFLTVSRGPWVGCFILILAFLLMRSDKYMSWRLGGLMFFVFLVSFLIVTPYGKQALSELPFFKSGAYGSIDYRVNLTKASFKVAKRNPIFGSNPSQYMATEELEEMRQGMGLIDMVNTYLGIVLRYGLVGLTLFILIFLGLLRRLYLSLKLSFVIKNSEPNSLGRCLFAIIIAVVVMIGTVSSISYIPVYYWLFIALSVSYLTLANKKQI